MPPQTVLICDNGSSVGLACVDLCHYHGAKVLLLAANEQQADALKQRQLPSSVHILNSAAALSSYSKGTDGIDVVIASSLGPQPRSIKNHLSPSGRYVSIQDDGRNAGTDDHCDLASPNSAYYKLDLNALARTSPRKIERLMARITKLRQDGVTTSHVAEVIHVSKVAEQLRKHSASSSNSSLTISWQRSTDKMPIQKPVFESRLDPNAAYILIGCLSELGRMFLRWAVDRGAKHFVMLSRSGGDTVTQDFLEQLRVQDIDVKVVKGDVSVLADVNRVVAASERPIRGVVQGALVLKDRLFESIDLESWDAQLKPRVQGTQNLHDALRGQPLDFFVMWSSLTEVFGTATQSAYLATCAFMNSFAAYRRSQGLPATSLCLGQIRDSGHFKGNKVLANSVARNGLYENEHAEFLQFCDAAISTSASNNHPTDLSTDSQLLAGIGPGGLRDLNTKHRLEDMSWYTDPRFSHIVKAVKQDVTKANATQKEDDDADVPRSVGERIRSKIAQLLYMAASDIDVDAPMMTYGIDSMVAAELKRWLHSVFAQDVSTMDILDGKTSVHSLEGDIAANTVAQAPSDTGVKGGQRALVNGA